MYAISEEIFCFRCDQSEGCTCWDNDVSQTPAITCSHCAKYCAAVCSRIAIDCEGWCFDCDDCNPDGMYNEHGQEWKI